MDIQENLKNKFSDVVKDFDIGVVNKVIQSFVGYEDDYNQLMKTCAVVEKAPYKDKDIVMISPSEKVSKMVSHGIRICGVINKLQKELDVIIKNLRIYGPTQLSAWNKENNDEAASVRIPNEDETSTVLISVKNAYSIDAEKLLAMKKSLGGKFDETFSTESEWSVKKGKIKDVIAIIKNSLGKAGAAFVKETFVEDVSIKVKSVKLLDKLYNDPEVSDEIKGALKIAIKPQQPSVSFPK